MYLDNKNKNEDVQKIVSHTIGELEPVYNFKHIMKRLRSINYKMNRTEAATVVKTE